MGMGDMGIHIVVGYDNCNIVTGYDNCNIVTGCDNCNIVTGYENCCVAAGCGNGNIVLNFCKRNKLLGCFWILQTLANLNQIRNYLRHKHCSFGYCSI